MIFRGKKNFFLIIGLDVSSITPWKICLYIIYIIYLYIGNEEIDAQTIQLDSAAITDTYIPQTPSGRRYCPTPGIYMYLFPVYWFIYVYTIYCYGLRENKNVVAFAMLFRSKRFSIQCLLALLSPPPRIRVVS